MYFTPGKLVNLLSSGYHSEVAVVSGLEWAVQAAAMEVVALALVAEAVEVWPGLESLKTQNHKDLERQLSTHRLLGHRFHIHLGHHKRSHNRLNLCEIQ